MFAGGEIAIEDSRPIPTKLEKGASFLHYSQLNERIRRKRKLHHLNRPRQRLISSLSLLWE